MEEKQKEEPFCKSTERLPALAQMRTQTLELCHPKSLSRPHLSCLRATCTVRHVPCKWWLISKITASRGTGGRPVWRPEHRNRYKWSLYPACVVVASQAPPTASGSAPTAGNPPLSVYLSKSAARRLWSTGPMHLLLPFLSLQSMYPDVWTSAFILASRNSRRMDTVKKAG